VQDSKWDFGCCVDYIITVHEKEDSKGNSSHKNNESVYNFQNAKTSSKK